MASAPEKFFEQLESNTDEQYVDLESSSEDGSATTLLGEKFSLRLPKKSGSGSLWQYVIVGGRFLMVWISIAMFVVGWTWRFGPADRCFDQHNAYSPGNEFVDHQYHLVQFNGSLYHQSPFSGPPSDEVDAAWNELTSVGIMSVTAEEVLKSGQSLDSVRFPPEVGSGQYIASVEVNHQLHCLNFLRKATHQDYYAAKAIEWTDDPETFRHHLDHCVEMIRQNIQCHADTGIITHNWVEHFPRPYPNFNTWHKCRNFDSVMSWVKKSQLAQRPPNGAEEWPKVPGSVVYAEPP